MQRAKLLYMPMAILFALFMFVSIFADKDDPWREWFYDWQPMLAGLLAIAAAVLTVHHLKEIDRQQQQRHDQIVGLTVRGDALRINRVAVPWARSLNDWAAKFDEIAVQVYRYGADPDCGLPTWSFIDELRAVMDQLSWQTGASFLQEAVPLFPARITQLMDELMEIEARIWSSYSARLGDFRVSLAREQRLTRIDDLASQTVPKSVLEDTLRVVSDVTSAPDIARSLASEVSLLDEVYSRFRQSLTTDGR